MCRPQRLVRKGTRAVLPHRAQRTTGTVLSLTVGTYSDGNLFVVYEIKRQVLPTAPSPTTTHLIVCIAEVYWNINSNENLEEKKQERYTHLDVSVLIR